MSVCLCGILEPLTGGALIIMQFILKYPLDFGIDPRTGQPLQVLNEGQASQVAQQSSPLREFGVNGRSSPKNPHTLTRTSAPVAE
eukprot:SAG11_NODE_165_length_13834_cov_72.998544_12_plen_85_part_00